jgi:hypothetical protein
MMTEHPAKNLAPHPQCQAATAFSPLRESWWTCSTLLMNLDSMLLALTCQPRPLLLLMYRGCWTICTRLTEEYSKFLIYVTRPCILFYYLYILFYNLLFKKNSFCEEKFCTDLTTDHSARQAEGPWSTCSI